MHSFFRDVVVPRACGAAGIWFGLGTFTSRQCGLVVAGWLFGQMLHQAFHLRLVRTRSSSQVMSSRVMGYVSLRRCKIRLLTLMTCINLEVLHKAVGQAAPQSSTQASRTSQEGSSGGSGLSLFCMCYQLHARLYPVHVDYVLANWDRYPSAQGGKPDDRARAGLATRSPLPNPKMTPNPTPKTPSERLTPTTPTSWQHVQRPPCIGHRFEML